MQSPWVLHRVIWVAMECSGNDLCIFPKCLVLVPRHIPVETLLSAHTNIATHSNFTTVLAVRSLPSPVKSFPLFSATSSGMGCNPHTRQARDPPLASSSAPTGKQYQTTDIAGWAGIKRQARSRKRLLHCDSGEGPYLVAKLHCLHPAGEQGTAPTCTGTRDP
jgi:hypothetical protein